MDYNNPLGIEYRVVNDSVHEGQDVRVVSGARTYECDVDDLWDALTNAERIPRWFSPISGDLKLDGRYQLEGNAGGTITRCEPPNALDVTWEYAGNVSWVTVRLESQEQGTRLTLAHLMGKDEASEEHWKKYGPGATGVGWELGFHGLGLHLQSGGQTVDQGEYEKWVMTTAGKDFVVSISTAWGEAHVESGEDREVAMAMAHETATFYTGGEHQH